MLRGVAEASADVSYPAARDPRVSMSRSDRARPTSLEDTIRERLPAPRSDLPLRVMPDRTDRLIAVLEGMDGFVVEFDVTGHAIYASPGIEAVLGFRPDEVVGSNRLELHPDDIPKAIAMGTKVRTTGRPATNRSRARHKDGRWVWIETTLHGWWAEQSGDFHTISFNRDITALKEAEAARRESETRYGAVSRMSRDLIVELDRTAQPTYFGPGAEDIFGYTEDELLAFDSWSLIHPDDAPHLREQMAQQFEDAEQGHAGEQRLMEYRARHREGHWIHLESLGHVYTRGNGEMRFLAVTRDVTERRRAEQARRDLEEGMRRAQKLESLGVLAGGIAHDFNNLLTPILGATALAREELPDHSPVHARLDIITRAARRAADLTDQMLAYAGQRPLRVERIDLSALIRDIRELAASSISGKTPFELDLADGLPPVEGETAQLSQVVLNLVTNASESMRDGVGRVTLRTGVLELEEPPRGALFAETMQAGKHVFFEVGDAGCGMEPETAGRIFDPFFTTKFTGRGLGLAAVAGIVRAHHGAIEVETEPGRGTTFRVLLPVAGEAPDEDQAEAATAPPCRVGGTALVIDDDEAVRELAAETLRRAGMTVLCAADGHEGVELFSEHKDEVRVVLLDRTMPTLSGADTLEAIRGVRADARIVLISGYSEERATAELARRDIVAFVQKPFLPETLLAGVRGALE